MRDRNKYFKYSGYKGEHYFKFVPSVNKFEFPEKVVHVCVSPGEVKRGRGNCIGIYLMLRISLIGNWSFFMDFKEATKAEFDKAFKKVFSQIK